MPDSTEPPHEPGSRRVAFRAPRPWFLLAFVLIVVVVSYLPVLGAPFVWDDHHLIEDSPLIQELHPVRDYFGQGFWQTDELGQGRAFYRPLTILSLALDHELYGDGSGGYHLSNLLVHLLCTVLLFRLLCVRGASGNAAALGTALWSLHPRLTEAVAWISGRTDVLASCFVLAALLAQSRPSPARRILCALLLLLALLSKEVALAGVAAVLVLELAPAAPLPVRASRALPALLALGVYVVLRVHASGIVIARSVPVLTLLRRATAAIGHYFAMFLVPWWPNVQIGQLSTPRLGYTVLGSVVVLCALGLLLRFRKQLTPAGWSALALIAVGLGSVLHFVPFSINVVAADRFLYLPLAGVVMLVTPLLQAFARVNFVAGACALLSLSFASATFVRADAWGDEVTLWTTTYRDNPDNEFLACAQLGRLYVRAGLFAQALSLYQGCTVTPVRRFVLVSNGASVLARTGHYREALATLDGLGEVARRTPLVAVNQSLFYTFIGDFESARVALTRALSADPSTQNARILLQQLPSLARAHAELRRLPSSAPSLERARLLQSLGLVAEGSLAWQRAFASGSLSSQEFSEGLAFVLAQADASTTDAVHREYRAQLARPESGSLELAYSARHVLGQRLLEAWPALGLPLLALPAASGS